MVSNSAKNIAASTRDMHTIPSLHSCLSDLARHLLH